uniref:Uncharacterized protein n=1 Tax=Anguilla anguilla TaxID=7936 RepID=A0A0E9S8K8_ANGAN
MQMLFTSLVSLFIFDVMFDVGLFPHNNF